MPPLLLALALAAAEPLALPPPVLSPEAPAAAPLAAAASIAAPTFRLPTSAPGPATFVLPVLALLALAAAALVALRRKRATAQLLRVVETTSLGPRRSLVVVRLAEELLVLGASEAGIQLLAARAAGGAESTPASLAAETSQRASRPVRLCAWPAAGPELPAALRLEALHGDRLDPADRPGHGQPETGWLDPDLAPAAGLAGDASAGRLRSLLGRLGGRRTGPRPARQSFEALLAESAEDQELRRKLASGLTGSVR